MNKPISWYALHKRIGNQTIHTTKSKYVEVLINGELWKCKLVFTNNGSDFHLEPVEKSNDMCDCFVHEYGEDVCYGTKEKDVCSCCGDKRKCSVYGVGSSNIRQIGEMNFTDNAMYYDKIMFLHAGEDVSRMVAEHTSNELIEVRDVINKLLENVWGIK